MLLYKVSKTVEWGKIHPRKSWKSWKSRDIYQRRVWPNSTLIYLLPYRPYEFSIYSIQRIWWRKLFILQKLSFCIRVCFCPNTFSLNFELSNKKLFENRYFLFISYQLLNFVFLLQFFILCRIKTWSIHLFQLTITDTGSRTNLHPCRQGLDGFRIID